LIEVPLLFVNGALDEFTTPEEAQKMAAYVSASRFATIDGAGHFLDLESRQARALTRAAILGFLGAPVAEQNELFQHLRTYEVPRVRPA
jgi:rhamnosyltransferase subunit A